MSTRFSNWLSKKDKTSTQPAGCVTGIFKLFDRQHLLGRRQLRGQEHEKNASDHALLSPGKHEADCREVCNLEKNLSRSYQENCRSSMESSSRTSLSSSSKSFSSLEHKSLQEEVQTTSTSRHRRSSEIKQSPGLRDIIKESDLKTNKVLKPIGSPGPTVDLSKLKDLEESLRILIKLKELPRDFREVSGSPRFSYDGRETKDYKHVTKQREHRRLSLDSMEDSRRCDFNSKFNSLVKELKRNSNHRSSEASNLLQDLETTNENYPSIVAKLMGLEPINPGRKNTIKGCDKESKQGKLLQSPTISPKFQRSFNQQMKASSNSRFAAEEIQQKMAVGSIDGGTKKKAESIYSLKEKTLQKSLSPQFIQPTSKSKKESISERASKSPTVILKPASKSAGASSSPITKLEGPAGLRKIRTSNRKKETFIVDGELTPPGKTANSSLKSLSKEAGTRAGNNSVSPRLLKKKPDQEKKSGALIPSFESKKTQRQPGSRQQSESVSPRGRIKQKPSKAQDIETPSEAKQMQYQMIPREVLYAKELDAVAPPLSSPNSVLDASLYPDDSPLSPLSVSSILNEDANLPSDHSNSHLGADFQKPESMDAIAPQFTVPGTTTPADEPPVTKYVAELLLGSGLLRLPSETAEKTGSQMLHRQLIFDVANEILARKKEACFNSVLFEPARLTPQLMFKELCTEIERLRRSGEGMLRDKGTVFTVDMLRRSKAWDGFESEAPAVALGIERLIFGDLVNEIVGSMSAVLESRERSRRKQLFS